MICNMIWQDQEFFRNFFLKLIYKWEGWEVRIYLYGVSFWIVMKSIEILKPR